MPDGSFGPEEFAAATDVSRETLARLKLYAGMLRDWNARHNLVSDRSLDDLWRRHFWDSAQLTRLISGKPATLADLGSGAGFPGLVLAELRRGELAVTLHEATAKKCDFLAAVATRLDLSVTIQARRMEDLDPLPFDFVTARACAPLDKLLGYAEIFQGSNTTNLFLKGQNIASELTEADKSWNMNVRQIPSLTDPSGVIVELKELDRRDRHKAPHPRRRQPEGRRR